MSLHRRLSRLAAGVVAALVVLPVVPATAAEPYQVTLDIAFPTVASAYFVHDYHQDRSGGARKHKATDVMAPKHSPAYAVVDGTICYINGIDEPMPSWGYSVSVCGEDGRRYAYLHMNNDTPGTDDGQGGPELAYAPGIRRGARVARGQLIAWVGDSGNAENAGSQIHFEVHDDRVTDPYGDQRIDPYPSLVAAKQRGEFPDGSILAPTAPTARVAGSDRVATAIELSRNAFPSAPAAVVAPAGSPSEAIVAGPLAAALGGPVLTTDAGSLDGRVRDELRRLGAEHVVTVGLGSGVAGALRDAGFRVEELGGSDRFATAAAVAQRTWELRGLAPTTQTTGVAPGVDGDLLTAAPTEPTLLVSDSRRRSEPVALDGASVAGPVAIFLDGVDPWQVEEVRFAIAGVLEHEERQEPYDLVGSGRRGAQLWDTADLVGTHTLEATVVGRDGSTTVVTATFEVLPVAGDGGMPVRRAIIALGSHPDPARAWPDSLMASYHGAATGDPVLLVAHDRVPSTTLAALDGVSELTVIGGTAAVADGLVETLASGGAQVTRLWGKTRYSTALAVADDLVQRGLVSPTRTWAATGRNWPDAATSGPVVAEHGDLLVLVDGDGTGGDAETRAYVNGRANAVERVVGIGGSKAVADTALRALATWAT